MATVEREKQAGNYTRSFQDGSIARTAEDAGPLGVGPGTRKRPGRRPRPITMSITTGKPSDEALDAVADLISGRMLRELRSGLAFQAELLEATPAVEPDPRDNLRREIAAQITELQAKLAALA